MMIRDMIKSIQLMEDELNAQMADLEPQFVLVGSIAEGTRTHQADELDLMVVFRGLQKNPFKLGNDGFTLCVSDGGPFPVEKFFFNFLNILDLILKKKLDISRITNGRMSIRDSNHCEMCSSFKYDPKIGRYFTHCCNHLPAVTHTKCGACLIFDWSDGNVSHILTIDLVPVFPINGSSVSELFRIVIKTLLTEPSNWLKYCQSFITKDAFLPESYNKTLEETSLEPLLVGMKILHYGDGGKNFLIRPIQQLGIETFAENKQLKDVYCHIKCLKAILDIDVSSYFIKKVLLTKEVKDKFKNKMKLHEYSMDVKRDQFREETELMENLHYCLNLQELRSKFNHIIDYGKWGKYSLEIPLLPQGTNDS